MKEKRKVLIVDYDHSSLDSLKKIFEKEGYQVYAAKDGEEACAFFFSKKPDLVVLEPFLPRLHGFDFLGKASEKFTKPFPLIVVTGFYSEAICRRDYLSYFDNYAFFNKPYQEKELLQAASRLLHKENGGQDEESQRPEVDQPGAQAAKNEDDNLGLPDPLNKVRNELEDLLKLAKERKAKRAGTPETKGEAGMEAKERDDLDLLIKDYLQKLKSEEKESQETFEDDVDEEIESLLEGELSGLLTTEKEGLTATEEKQSKIDEEKLDQRLESLVESPQSRKEESSLSEDKDEGPSLEKGSEEEMKKVEASAQEGEDGDSAEKEVLSQEKTQDEEKDQRSEEVETSGSSQEELQESASLKNKQSDKENDKEADKDENSGQEQPQFGESSLPPEKAVTSSAKKEEAEVAVSEEKEPEMDKPQAAGSTPPEGLTEGENQEEGDDKEVNFPFSGSVFDQVKSKKTLASFLPLGLGVAGVGVVVSLLIIFLSGKSPAEKSVAPVQANLAGRTQEIASVTQEKPANSVVQAKLKEDSGQTASGSVELKGMGTIKSVTSSGEGQSRGQIEVKTPVQNKKPQGTSQQSVEPLVIPLEPAGVTLKEVNSLREQEKVASSKQDKPSRNEAQPQGGQMVKPEKAAAQKGEQSKPVSSATAQPAKINTGDLVPLNLVDKPPQVIEKVMPKYPPQALRFGVKGQVVVMALISENGYVLETRLLRGIEKSFGLNEASLEAVMKWRFKPAEKDGVKVKVWKPISFVFQGKDTTQEESPWN